jgi:hypothetical protein
MQLNFYMSKADEDDFVRHFQEFVPAYAVCNADDVKCEVNLKEVDFASLVLVRRSRLDELVHRPFGRGQVMVDADRSPAIEFSRSWTSQDGATIYPGRLYVSGRTRIAPEVAAEQKRDAQRMFRWIRQRYKLDDLSRRYVGPGAHAHKQGGGTLALNDLTAS